MIRRPTITDVPALGAGTAMLVWPAIFVDPWVLLGGLGVLVAAVTTARWPGTVAALVALLAVAAGSPAAVSALVTGLLIAAYLVVLDGPPSPRGLAPVGVGVALAVLVTVGAVAVGMRASVWWVLAAALAIPILLSLTRSGVPPGKEQGDG